MKQWMNIAALVLSAATLLGMLVVFFACGDDAEDVAESIIGDDDEGPCHRIVDRLFDCREEGTQFTVHEKDLLFHEACFLSWCAGTGDEAYIGKLSGYDFQSECFMGDCQELYDGRSNPECEREWAMALDELANLDLGDCLNDYDKSAN